jgi:hypothetical protein
VLRGERSKMRQFALAAAGEKVDTAKEFDPLILL